MERTNKLKMNSAMSTFNRIAILLSGIILPRYILIYFGSEANGLVASISQFLNIITFLDLGVGSVVQSALYKPLSEENDMEISKVYKAAKIYFQKISYVLIGYVLFLVVFYPLLIDSSYSYLSTIFLILALSLSQFSQYYFGIANELLLNANQRGYVQLGTEIIVVFLNLIISILLIKQGFSIHIVKLVSSLVYLLRPIFLTYYVRKNFNINYEIEVSEDPLPQKWNGVGQHIAYSIQNSTDVTVLTMFSSLENVSVYIVYNMVVRGVRLLFTSITAGLTPFFGNLLANNEHKLLNDYFSKLEWLLHTSVIYLFSMTAVLINDFIKIYTRGINDVDYNAPLFSLLLILAYIMYSVRTPYRILIFAAGHFKETQLGSFIEAGLNIVISLILVTNYDLIGVALATFISMTFQTIYLVNYLSKNILYRSKNIFLKQILIDSLTFMLVTIIGHFIISFIEITNFLNWMIVAIILAVVFLIIIVLINIFFYRKHINFYFNRIIKK